MAQLAVEMTSDEARLFRGLQKIITQQDRLREGFKKTGEAGNQAGRDMDAGFKKGETAAKSVYLALAGSGGIAAGIAFATKGMRDFLAATEQAGERVKQMQQDMRALFQLSAGPQLKAVANSLRVQFGMDEKGAANLVFTAASAGEKYVKNLRDFARARDLGLDPESLIAGQQKIESAFGKDMSSREFISKALAAAGPSNVRTDDLAKALSTATVSFAATGGTPEELFAVGSVLANTFKSPEAAAERINSLSRQLQKNIGDVDAGSLMGLDLMLALGDLEKAGAITRGEGKNRQRISVEELLGDATAVEGYRALTAQAALIQQRENEIVNVGDLFGERLKFADADPSFSAARRAEIATEKREVAEEPELGTAANLAKAAKEDISRQHAARGSGFLTRAIDQVNMMVSELVMGPEAFSRSLMPNIEDAELRHQIGAFTNRKPDTSTGGLGGLLGDMMPSAELGMRDAFSALPMPGGGNSGERLREAPDTFGEAVKAFEKAVERMLKGVQRIGGAGPTGAGPNEDR